MKNNGTEFEPAQTSEELSSLLNAGSDGILVLDNQGMILFSNQAAEGLLNKGSGELKGWLFGSPAIIGQATEIETISSEGTVRRIEMLVRPLRWHGQSAMVASLRDITEHVRLQQYLDTTNKKLVSLNQELEAAKEKALELSRLKSEFFARLSHEIRTPLAGIVGLSELLSSEDGLSEDQLTMASEISISAQRLYQALCDFLDFSKLESGMFPVSQRNFSIHTVLTEHVASFEKLAESKGIRVSIQIDEHIPAVLFGDETKIKQVLSNLTSNALKFTRQGRIEIAACLLKKERDQFTVKIAVTDTGIGLDSEQLSKLFLPYVQVHNSAESSAIGTGLGLSISKSFVELMGGEIGVESVRGSGSTFWFTVMLFENELVL